MACYHSLAQRMHSFSFSYWKVQYYFGFYKFLFIYFCKAIQGRQPQGKNQELKKTVKHWVFSLDAPQLWPEFNNDSIDSITGLNITRAAANTLCLNPFSLSSPFILW